MQRFKFKSSKSSKFWQIEQQGAELHIRRGKQGTAGQCQVKSVADEANAMAVQDELGKEKAGKGLM